MESSNEVLARAALKSLGDAAAQINRQEGCDTGINRLRTIERNRMGMAMIQRLLPSKNATLRDIMQLAVQRFAELKKVVDSAAQEPPSIVRFERVCGAMGAAILESAKNQDWLFEFSGAFRRGFDILAERPKRPDNVTSPEDLFFTTRERAHILRAIVRLLKIIAYSGSDCNPMPSVIGKPEIPERLSKILAKYRPDSSTPITDKIRTQMMAEVFFSPADNEQWVYDGWFFRYLKRYFGVLNAECFDPEDFLEQWPELLLDLPLTEIVESPEGQAMGTAILSAMSSGKGNPEMAYARTDEVVGKIAESIVRQLLPAEELTEPTSEPPDNPKPKGWSKYAGQTLRRRDGSWLKIERDGVTLKCPTRIGEGVAERSYTLPNASQVEFLKPLIECFETGGWHKPKINKAKWQGKFFKRGDAEQFLKDKHIELWHAGQKGGSRGCIRLAVASTRAKTP